ncbi:MAG: M28 family peptidase [bacterium]|nr:M28 family peptidase [bacterium]
MNEHHLIETAGGYLDTLCGKMRERCVGREGNRAATTFFAETIRKFGFAVETPEFDCFDWKDGGSCLEAAGTAFNVKTGPYTKPLAVTAPLCAASSLEELKALDAQGKILLLSGAIAGEQLMPKIFPFYNPDHHKEIVKLLENGGALGIVSATTKDPGMTGAVYPFPLIEDGDFGIPSVYMTDVEGKKLLRYVGQQVSLTIDAQRLPAKGCNVTAIKKGSSERRIVFCAHIDAKQGTPGAIDNATGVAVLLLLAELLQHYDGGHTVEITALNGEDYYSAPGQRLYLRDNKETLANIDLVVNLDGAGYLKGNSNFSMYRCNAETESGIRSVMGKYAGIAEGPQWYQSDHSIFIQKGVSAVAVTSNGFMEVLAAEITHTEKDVPGIVDCGKLAEIAVALRDIPGSVF